MKSKEEIIKILPEGKNTSKVETTPRQIMNLFVDAIKEKYPKYFNAFVTETAKIPEGDNSSETLSYSFYLVAYIGKGYNYKLFEVVPKRSDSPYPIELILFERNPSNEGEFNNENEFSEKLCNFFKSSFFDNVINNLMGQVDLFRESRGENK
ncbi:hypothetical protein [Lutibacter sp.]|uniref:hypothetical protein n=1 Tax=Lutibacter sp. TaxID=1925666 RepID=UPI001A2CC9C4|nr:hypothetical protein [Lutibacter sp.]MBI9041964.1 hypothetical protein [Lutibacter sp.]